MATKKPSSSQQRSSRVRKGDGEIKDSQKEK